MFGHYSGWTGCRKRKLRNLYSSNISPIFTLLLYFLSQPQSPTQSQPPRWAARPRPRRPRGPQRSQRPPRPRRWSHGSRTQPRIWRPWPRAGTDGMAEWRHLETLGLRQCASLSKIQGLPDNVASVKISKIVTFKLNPTLTDDFRYKNIHFVYSITVILKKCHNIWCHIIREVLWCIVLWYTNIAN